MSHPKEYDIFELVGKSEANLRKLMTRTVEAYPLEWLVVHEAIQNSRDAIQRCGLAEGLVDVTFDLTNQAVSVQDNGCGFNHDISLLGIGGTDKDTADWTIQGNQGVGLKAVLLSTSDFKLEAVRDKRRWVVTCKEAYEYKNGKEVKIVEYPITDTAAQNGTTVSYRFPDKRVSGLLKLIWWYGQMVSPALAADNLAKMKTAIEWYFRSYTYAGDVNRLLGLAGIKPIIFKVKLTYAKDVPAEFDGQLKEVLPKLNNLELTFPNIQWDIASAVNSVEKGKPKPVIINYDIPDGGKFPGLNSNVIWTSKFTDPDQYKLLLRNSSLKDQPNAGEYEELFNSTLGIYIAIGSLETLRAYIIENPRRFVAANGIPSSHLVRDPTKGGELTYNRNIHFIMNVNAKLNYGKQNITNTRMLGDIYSFYTDAYRATLKNIAKSIVGTEVVESGGGGYFDRYADRDTNILARPTIAIEELSIKRVPKDENAVIALFYDMVGRGILKDYESYSLHGRSRYDARMMLKHSGMKTMPVPHVDNDLAVVEFKQTTSGLIDDFENDRKIPKEIHLLIVWENDFDENAGYQVVNIEHTPEDDRRFFGVKKCLKDKMSGWHIQMLILREFVQDLKDAGK